MDTSPPNDPQADADPAPDTAYQVLARKYRPQDFATLIGQDALVRTLTNAFAENRIAHAFMLTGVRGVGKTTTARIIAKALNCTGADGGTSGPRAEPCGVCDNCVAIAESRHVDVQEMDAASRTGVDDIRELIDGVRYLPVQARFKVYIVDEVHMLSRNAFNALLKTLEEPPEHVKFVFATTEIRKVPVTVLSRCQRFDLRRVDGAVLQAHFRTVVEAEGATVEDEALALIARASEGSVRDGLSLLDQAIAHGAGRADAALVREMLGLADRARVYDLLEACLRGETAAALAGLRALYDLGAEPSVVLADMLELVHWLTTLQVSGGEAGDGGLGSDTRARAETAAAALSVPVLSRAWQILLKGLGEVRAAPSMLPAAEMILVRLCYVADLPTPAEAVAQLQEGGGSPGGASPGGGTQGGGTPGGGAQARGLPSPALADGAPADALAGTGAAPVRAEKPSLTLAVRAAATDAPPAIAAGAAPENDVPAEADRAAMPGDFAALTQLVWQRKEARLASVLRQDVHLVSYEPGRLLLAPGPKAPRDLVPRLTAMLEQWTGRDWHVAAQARPDDGGVTLAEAERAEADALRARIAGNPLVQAVMQTFPGAELTDIRPLDGEPDDGAPESSEEDPA